MLEGLAYPQFRVSPVEDERSSASITSYLDNGLPSVVCFYASWCQSEDLVDEIQNHARIFSGRANLMLVNIDQTASQAIDYGVQRGIRKHPNLLHMVMADKELPMVNHT